MTINSNSAAIHTYNNISLKRKIVEETKSIQDIQTEKIDDKSETGIDRYNFLGIEGWFSNSIIEKDEKLKENFESYLNDMTKGEYISTMISFAHDFMPQLVQNENGEVINGPSRKDPDTEFASITSIINYFQNSIKIAEANVAKYGGDGKESLDTLKGLLDFFKNYESQEQENQYIALGQGNKNA